MDRYVIKGGQAGHARLQVLARAQRRHTLSLLDQVRLRDGMQCLDMGCGSGDVTFDIAERIGQAGHVTGLDMDEVKLSLAREAAAQRGLTNVAFRVANVNDWQEVDAYELVYCRFLLQHLSRPLDLLRKMWASLRVGGVLIVEDTDFDGTFCHPPNDAFDFYVRNYIAVLKAHGGDPMIGRKLLAYFAEAGISTPELNLVQRVESVGEGKMISYLTLEATADAIVNNGLATEDDVKTALVSLLAYTQDPTTVIGDPRVFQLWAHKQPVA
jgi:ubiquinone/menaquinone biosynthesis C-methylase UbiE